MIQKELIEKERELVEFSFKTFDYFNGRINIINDNVKLMINPYSNLSPFKYDTGYLKGCNQIYYIKLNLYTLIEVYKEYEDFMDIMKLEIIFIIIHELYHADQQCNMSIYSTNSNYWNKIERDVVYMTYLYLIHHYEQIKKDLDFFICEYDINELYWSMEFNKKEEINNSYKRVNIVEYYIDLLNRLFVAKNIFTNELYYGENFYIIFHHSNISDTDDIEVYNYKEIIIKQDYKFNTNFSDINEWMYNICYGSLKALELRYIFDEEDNSTIVFILYDYKDPIKYFPNPIKFVQKEGH